MDSQVAIFVYHGGCCFLATVVGFQMWVQARGSH